MRPEPLQESQILVRAPRLRILIDWSAVGTDVCKMTIRQDQMDVVMHGVILGPVVQCLMFESPDV